MALLGVTASDTMDDDNFAVHFVYPQPHSLWAPHMRLKLRVDYPQVIRSPSPLIDTTVTDPIRQILDIQGQPDHSDFEVSVTI